jgi:hypothetical protein
MGRDGGGALGHDRFTLAMVSPDRILAMQQAIEDRNLPKVKLLLKAGVPAEHYYHPSLGLSFAKLAAHTGDLAIFCCLVDAGANIKSSGAAGAPLLQEAVCTKSASTEIVAKVLAEGACSQSDLDRTLLFAPEFGNLEIVNRLLAAGASPRFKDDDGASALMHAVLYQRSAIALRLLEAGADPTLRVPYEEHYKQTIVEVAAINQMHDVVRACGGPLPAPDIAAPLLTLSDAVHAIEAWLQANAPEAKLRAPRDTVSLPAPFSAAVGHDDLTAWFSLHDGSDELAMVPMPDDISYCLLSLDESLQGREGMLKLFAQEGDLADVPRDFWRDTWLPIATNGAGDYLVWDAATGHVLRFSHETRLASLRADSLLIMSRDIASGLLTGKYTYSDARGIA